VAGRFRAREPSTGYDAGMRSRPAQFGILALLILTAAAAVSFAIIRLRLPLVATLLMIQTVVVCFLGWAVRNRKYADPRLPQPKLSALQILLSLTPALLAGVVWLLLLLMLNLKFFDP
jgi:hypothetical protein